MITRCHVSHHKDFHSYGGRGIWVCDEWRGDFKQFVKDMGPKPSPEHSLGRIDNDLGYFPANCRWETTEQQFRNRRITVFIEYNDVKLSSLEWARILGCDLDALTMRKRRGWSDKDIIETPVVSRHRVRSSPRKRHAYRENGLHAALKQHYAGKAA